MQVYDAIHDQGLHIHLSLFDDNSCYLLILNVYTCEVSIRWFTTYFEFMDYLGNYSI